MAGAENQHFICGLFISNIRYYQVIAVGELKRTSLVSHGSLLVFCVPDGRMLTGNKPLYPAFAHTGEKGLR